MWTGKRRLRIVLGWCLLALAAAALPAATPAVATTADTGRTLFLQHCASCHGIDGSGDGPDADLFPAPPRDLRPGFLAKYDDATLLRRIRDGRALPLVLDPEALARHARQVDAIVAHLKRLPDIDWQKVEPGWAAWVDRCEVCHGPTGEGPSEAQTATPPPDLTRAEFRTRLRGAALTEALRHGRGGMPPIDPPVSAAEAEVVLPFVDLLSPGFSAYSRFCANCHADDGRGAATLGEVPGDILPMPAFAFDHAYFAKRSDAEVRAQAWHMLETRKPSMPHFRVVLPEPEAQAILAWLRTLAPATPAPAPR